MAAPLLLRIRKRDKKEESDEPEANTQGRSYMAVTRTAVTDNPGSVNVAACQGQFLHFSLNAGGPIPIFTFSSSAKGVILEAADFPGHPKTLYEWDHLKNPSDIQQLETLTLLLSFFSNAQYTYKVELLDKTGKVIQTVLEIQYTGAPTDDAIPESFLVVIV
jgi:hypothetical protein